MGRHEGSDAQGAHARATDKLMTSSWHAWMQGVASTDAGTGVTKKPCPFSMADLCCPAAVPKGQQCLSLLTRIRPRFSGMAFLFQAWHAELSQCNRCSMPRADTKYNTALSTAPPTLATSTGASTCRMIHYEHCGCMFIDSIGVHRLHAPGSCLEHYLPAMSPGCCLGYNWRGD